MFLSRLKANPRLCLALCDFCVGIFMTFPIVIFACMILIKDRGLISVDILGIVMHVILMMRFVMKEACSTSRLIYSNIWRSISFSVIFAGLGGLITFLYIGPILKNPWLNVGCLLITTLTAFSTMCICSVAFYSQTPLDRAKWVKKQISKLRQSPLLWRSELRNASLMVETLFVYMKNVYQSTKQEEKLRKLNKIPPAGKTTHIRLDQEGFLNRLESRLDCILRTLESEETN